MKNQQIVTEIEAVNAKTAKGVMQDLLDRAKVALETQTVTVDPSAELNAKKLQTAIEKAEDLTNSELGVIVAQGTQKVVAGFEAIGKMLIDAGEDYKKVTSARDVVQNEIKALTNTKAELLSLAQVVNARVLAEAEKSESLAKLEAQIDETQALIDSMMEAANAEIKQLKADAKKAQVREIAEFEAQHEYDKKQAILKLQDELNGKRRLAEAQIEADKAKVAIDREALNKDRKELGDTKQTISDLQAVVAQAGEAQTQAVEDAVTAKEAELKKEFKYEKDLLVQQKANEVSVLTREVEMKDELIEDLRSQIADLKESQALAYNNIQAMAGKVADAAGSQKVSVNVPTVGSSDTNKR